MRAWQVFYLAGQRAYVMWAQRMLQRMKLATLFMVGVGALFAQTPNPDKYYQLGPDSLPQEGVPKRRDPWAVCFAQQGVSRHGAHLLGVCVGPIRSGAGGEAYHRHLLE